MAEEVESSPAPAVCPSSPRPTQASVFVAQNAPGGGSIAGAAKNVPDGPPCLPMIPPPGPFGGQWTSGPPPGFGHIKPPPSIPTGNQIPHAGTVFGTEQRPPPASTPEICGGPPPSESSIFGNRAAPDDSSLDAHSQTRSSPDPPRSLAGRGLGHRYRATGMERCNAIASTRVYNKNLRCDRCGGQSALGWYYRCCDETDTRIYESIQNGNEEHFDEIGKQLSQTLKQPVRGPAARQDKLAPLNELSPAQLEALTAPQLATILRQHEKAVNTALEDRHGPMIPPADEKPYLVPQIEECRTTLCPRCGRMANGEQQSFLNLDGILNGDIPPSAAVGFGFRALGGRPVADARIVRNLGLRDPMTGLLPGQKAKGAAAAAAEADAEAAKSADAGVQIAGTSSDMDDSKLSERTAGLDLDEDTSGETHGPETPAVSVKDADSAEDLVQLYLDAEDGTLSNSVHEDSVEGGDDTHSLRV